MLMVKKVNAMPFIKAITKNQAKNVSLLLDFSRYKYPCKEVEWQNDFAFLLQDSITNENVECFMMFCSSLHKLNYLHTHMSI